MKTLGLYIHIPFCEQKCPYCDFYSIRDKSEYDNYVVHLKKHIKQWSEKYRRIIDTIYFGGGTPSVIGSDRLINILNTIKRNFVLSDDCEITVEVNPCSAKNMDFKALRQSGFNRLSIGLQSAVENELKLLGRRHSANDAKLTVDKARAAGFDNISLDLMLCVPSQTKSSLAESIKFCKDCGIEHISAYILKIEENTLFYQIKDSLKLFDDDEQALLYKFVVHELERYGYKQYEVSNFAKEGFESKHNLRYWKCDEYLGFGPSAHSFVDGKRFYYTRNLDDFYANKIIEDGSGGDINEYIMLALRLSCGLSLDELNSKYNYTPSKKLLTSINKLKEERLVNIDNNIISLTVDGFLVSNTIINFILNSL